LFASLTLYRLGPGYNRELRTSRNFPKNSPKKFPEKISRKNFPKKLPEKISRKVTSGQISEQNVMPLMLFNGKVLS
jgi:hypothetical protein